MKPGLDNELDLRQKSQLTTPERNDDDMSNNAIIVAGIAGRMGRAIAAEVLRMPGLALAGGFDRPGGADSGKDIGTMIGTDALGLQVEPSRPADLNGAAVMIDFSATGPCVENVNAARANGAAHVIGVTGFTEAEEAAIKDAAKSIAIVKSGNMSLGVNLLTALVEDAAKRLDDRFDIEIFEAHHRHKVDAPSGTALMLGDAAARGRGVDLDDKSAHARGDRSGARKDGDIGFSVFRGGGVVGEHRVSFASMDEILTLEHKAINRSLFAQGAVTAAKWAIGKPPGLYSMRDVLGL